jgi:hypothetical protein
MSESVAEHAVDERVADRIASYEAVREFLRGRGCRITYRTRRRQGAGVRRYDRTAFVLDFDREGMRHRVLEGMRPMEPVLSLDGARIAYNRSFGPTELFVYALGGGKPPVRIGFGANPRWWVDTGTGEEYIVYRTDCDKTAWPELPGITLKQKIRRGGCVPVGEPVRLYPKGFGAGLTPDGRYLVTGYAALDIVDLVTSQHFQLFGGRQVCSVSIAPDDTNRLMELRLPHDTFGFHDLDGTNDTAIAKPDGTLEWLTPCWSNHPDFAVAAARTTRDTHDLYLIRLSDQAMLNVVAGGQGIHPYLWIGG